MHTVISLSETCDLITGCRKNVIEAQMTEVYSTRENKTTYIMRATVSVRVMTDYISDCLC